MYGFVYKTTNLINNKYYIGKRKLTNNFYDKTYLGSGLKLKPAIKKYGKNNFKREILEECENLKTLNEREKYWIAKLKGPNCYNISEGGDGGSIRKGMKNSKHHNYLLKKLNTGRKMSESVKQKMSLAKIGKIPWNKGKKMSKEYCERCKNNKIPYNGKKVFQYDLSNNLIKEWKDLTQIRLHLGFDKRNISACCVGKRKTAYGYIWKH